MEKIKCFGGLRITLKDEVISVHGRLCDEILLSLLLEPSGITPEKLHARVCPGNKINSLHQGISQLRHCLGEEISKRILLKGGKYFFDRKDLDLDIHKFELAIKNKDILTATEEYTEELLPEFNKDWILAIRENYYQEYKSLFNSTIQNISNKDAVLIWERLTKLRPQRETHWIGLIEALEETEEYDRLQEQLRAYKKQTHQTGTIGSERIQKLWRQWLPDEEHSGYIVRAADRLLADALRSSSPTIVVQGARQTGKTELLARALSPLRLRGQKILLTPLGSWSTHEVLESNRACQRLAEVLGEALGIEHLVSEVWDAKRTPTRNLERFTRDHILQKLDCLMIWVIDDVDRLFSCPDHTDIFRLFRSWHERHRGEPEGVWGRLRLVLSCATEARLHLRDPDYSPFNVAVPIDLHDFTPAERREFFAQRGQKIEEYKEEERQLLEALLGGHPGMLSRAALALADPTNSVRSLCQRALDPDGPFGGSARRLVALVESSSELHAGVTLLLSRRALDRETFWRMRSAGLVIGETAGQAQWRNGFTRLVFEEWKRG